MQFYTSSPCSALVFCYDKQMQLGKLTFIQVQEALDLVAPPVSELIQRANLRDIYVAAIDATLADTAAFCEHYGVGLAVSANCVIVIAKRAEVVRYAACMILATDRIDVNNVVRRYLDARKISFAAMDQATTLTAMEYGGITPIGLPPEWPILVDTKVAGTDKVIVGSGLRTSKLLMPGQLVAHLPNARVLDIAQASA